VKGFIFNPIIKVKINTNNKRFTEFAGIDYLYKDFSYDTQDSIKIAALTINKEYRISRKVHAISKNLYNANTLMNTCFMNFILV